MYVPSSELGLSHPPSLASGGGTRLRVRGWGSPNSDDWRKSIALCLLCAYIPDGDDIGLPPALAGEGGIGEYLAGVPVDDVESLHLARVPEIVGHRLVHAQVRVLGRHLPYLAKN